MYSCFFSYGTFSLLHPPSQPINHPVRHASQSGQLAHSCASLQTTGDYLITLLLVHFQHLDRVRNAITIQQVLTYLGTRGQSESTSDYSTWHTSQSDA